MINANKKSWHVVVIYDCGLGPAGTVLSKHLTYSLASKKLRKTSAYFSFLGIKYAE